MSSPLPAAICDNMMHMGREEKLVDLIDRLRARLGDALHRVSLYGSRAREDWRPDSDWDVLVVLNGQERDRVAEDRVLDVVTDFELDHHYDLCISVQTVSEGHFEKFYASPYPFWTNFRRDEKVLWTRTSA